jgi:predicted nucleic acid-binding protein
MHVVVTGGLGYIGSHSCVELARGGHRLLIVAPKRRLRVVKDEPDNRILECAVAGRGEAIVTEDKALLALKRYGETRMLALRDYLDGR